VDQTGNYTNVTITARLNGGVATSTTANIYLLNALGPETTAAANQIAYELETIPAGTHGVTLFTGLTLGPGTYYPLADEVSAGWTGSSSPVYTTDAGVSNIFAACGKQLGTYRRPPAGDIPPCPPPPRPEPEDQYAISRRLSHPRLPRRCWGFGRLPAHCLVRQDAGSEDGGEKCKGVGLAVRNEVAIFHTVAPPDSIGG
jgi:hypothetical protein